MTSAEAESVHPCGYPQRHCRSRSTAGSRRGLLRFPCRLLRPAQYVALSCTIHLVVFWENDTNDGSAAFRALNAQTTSVFRLDDLRRERQAEAGAVLLARRKQSERVTLCFCRHAAS